MVPEIDILERYISGELNSSESRSIEQQLREDPLLADAIEGLKEIKDMKVARASLHRLYQDNRQRVQQRMSKREQLSRRQSRVGLQLQQHMPIIIGVAAGLVILILSVFVLRKLGKKDELIAENNSAFQPQMNIPPPALIDSLPEEEEEQNTEITEQRPERIPPDIRPKPNSSLPSPPAKTKAEPKPAPSALPQIAQTREEKNLPQPGIAFYDSALQENPPEPVTIIENRLKGREDLSSAPNQVESLEALPKTRRFRKKKTKARGDMDKYDDIPLVGESQIGNGLGDPPQISRKDSIWVAYYKSSAKISEDENQKAHLLRVNAISDLLYEGIFAYRTDTLDLAREKFEEVIRSSPTNVLAHYYKGLVEKKDGNFKAAAKAFRHNLKYPKSQVYEDSRWKLAQTYLEAGKKWSAKRMLKKIQASDSPYAPAAAKQLELMD